MTSPLYIRLNTQSFPFFIRHSQSKFPASLPLHLSTTLLITRGLLISLSLNPPPLLAIIRIIHRIGGNTDRLILDLLRQNQIQEDGQKPCDREPGLHDQDNRVEEPLFGLVGPAVREHIREPLGHEDGADAQRQCSSEDEPVPAREGHGGDDADARDGDASKQKGGEAAQDGGGDRHERGREFGEDAHDEEEEAGAVAGFAIGAASECYYAIVLGEHTHRRDGAEGGDESVESVREDAPLDPGVEELAFDFETGDIAGGGDVTNSFHHEHNVDGHQW